VDEQIQRALTADRTIDITTTGRHSGTPRRIEIWFHNLDGAIYITGLPGKRAWYANLVAQPAFTFHLKGDVKADLAAHARPVSEPQERRRVLDGILERLGRSGEIEDWMVRSPLVAVTFDES
jgi:deazaflavin-dependent oxidoreductase (nitroreductase family)